jgi:hypothetical protein
MTRRFRRLAPLALVALATLSGCQDYNFSPVNQCLIQPGNENVTLSDNSTADLLFVVDDSGSMGGEQKKLAESFDAFVGALTRTNSDRVGANLEPIDFHIAITTTSVFVNNHTGASCSAACAGQAGLVCCDVSNQPLKAPRGCLTNADCTGAGVTCKDLGSVLGSPGKTCADAADVPVLVPVACQVVGQPCGELQMRYQFNHGPRSCVGIDDCGRTGDTCSSTCTSPPDGQKYCCAGGTGAIDPLRCNSGVATEYAPYPRGDFVKAATSTRGTPPRVIHFTKDLFCTRGIVPATGKEACTGPAPAAAATAILDRIAWFKANVAVGTCGSPQEQGLEAARRALKKALRLDGLSQPSELDGSPSAWPQAKSKLVTVWVGDEDDCSTPESATAGVILSRPTVADPNPPEACRANSRLPADQQKLHPLTDYSSFLSGLGRPLATGFIVSADGMPTPPETDVNRCVDASCVPNRCYDPTCDGAGNVCGGQGEGFRYLELASTFRSMGSDVVAGSICDPGTPASLPPLPGFSSILQRVAEVVKQPSGLKLPSQPASAALTILRIVGTNGKTRTTCSAPAPVVLPSGATLNDYHWWFTDGNDLHSQIPTGASRFIHLNPAVQGCTANPGETYAASYLGLVPAEGCDTAADCALTLGTPPTWTTTPWECRKEAGAARGTCLCGS